MTRIAPAVSGVAADGDWFEMPVPDNVVFGEGSFLYSSYALLHFRSRHPVGLRLGRQTGVYEGTQFCLGPNGQVHIGDYCTIVATVFSTNSEVVLGECVMFGYGVIVSDDPFGRPGAADGRPTAPIVIEDNVWVGARSVLLPGASIGRDSVIGAGSLIDGPVPPGVVMAGNPARIAARLT